MQPPNTFFHRDISWLSFNERVLTEAGKPELPLIERIKFLSIYSSNLDEFYRVRVPVLMALEKMKKKNKKPLQQTYLEQAQHIIRGQLELFGSLLKEQIIPQLKQRSILLVYDEPLPSAIEEQIKDYFFTTIAAFIQIAYKEEGSNFFFENNKLYLVVILQKKNREKIALINIPSDQVSRFFTTTIRDQLYIVFIDDIIKANISYIFPDCHISGVYSIKVTRDAELDLQDEYEGDIAEKIETQINKRDLGLATRILYQPGLPSQVLAQISDAFSLAHANTMEGGNYHNLKDFISFPYTDVALLYPKRTPLILPVTTPSLFDTLLMNDLLVHTPYHSYATILRFFNEAAINNEVEEIYTTMYRVAHDSKIAHALITAARNGKKVAAFVELKARFDEANNIRWARVMKAAGVKIIYSIPGLKVHAKVAMVKKKQDGKTKAFGLFATGNLNESTARFYTDHILLTAGNELLAELDVLFAFLSKRKKPELKDAITFHHLLVAQFNLQATFFHLIDNEIAHAKAGLPAAITIKLNNLEEEKLITRLYEASNAGVTIHLIIRSICRLIPGIKGMSENITVKRIIDRYLEHGRIFIFHNKGDEKVLLGSADWMNRNIYRRIEVCFPVNNETLKNEIRSIINLQWQDNISAAFIDEHLANKPVMNDEAKIQSQEAIYFFLKKQ